MRGYYTARTDVEALRAFLMNMQEYNLKQVRRYVFLYPNMTRDKLKKLVSAKRRIAGYSKIVSAEILKENPDMIVLKALSRLRNEICSDLEKEMLL